MSRNLIDAIAEAMKEHDASIQNDIEPWDYYTEKAEVAVGAYDEFQSTPRPRAFYVEGVQFA